MKIHHEIEDGVLILTLEGDNDLNLGVVSPELHAHLMDYLANESLRCAVITGHGVKAFSAGGDLKRAAKEGFGVNFWSISENHRDIMRKPDFPKPMIAAVNGYCLGEGMMFSMLCDIRLASRNATFGLPEVKHGFSPGLGATQRLPRLIGVGPALEMLMTGDSISAEQAERWGLVNRVVELPDLMPTARAMARRIAENPPLAIRSVRELAVLSHDVPLHEGLRAESMLGEIVRSSEDAKEGPRAFAEKRKPRYLGR